MTLPSTRFKAWRVEEQQVDGKTRYVGRVMERQVSELPPGEVLLRVRYSSLNYKDALSASGNRGVTRQYPHTPGIDAAGEVLHSDVPEITPGSHVIVTGYDLGMNTDGGFAQRIRVPAQWLVPLPEGLSLFDSMALGTAGLTAALCVRKLLEKSSFWPPSTRYIMEPMMMTSSRMKVRNTVILARLAFRARMITSPSDRKWPSLKIRNTLSSRRARITSKY